MLSSGKQSKEIVSNSPVNDQRSLQMVSGQRCVPIIAIWLLIISVRLMLLYGKKDLCEIHTVDVTACSMEKLQVGFIFSFEVIRRNLHSQGSIPIIPLEK